MTKDKTATQILTELQDTRFRLGPAPDHIKTEEEYCRWALAEIDRQARIYAEPFIRTLVAIENMKPPKPIFISPDGWNDSTTNHPKKDDPGA